VRHLACAELVVTLRLEGGRRDVRRLRLAAPAREPRTWLRRLLTALELDPPGAAVEACAVAAEGAAARRDQLDLFRPAGPAPAALDALLAELEALCGPERIGAPRVPDDPRPGAHGLAPFAPPPPGAPLREDGSAAPVLAVRALRPALPAEVTVCAGRPARVRSALASGDVVRCAGPWRATGGWWAAERRHAFDSFDVATSDGLLVRLRFDHGRRVWEIDAVYD
jgi:protein ImuB